MPTTDRDLIVLEPSLFRDHAWLGQRLVIGSASITGGVVTSIKHDLDQSGPGKRTLELIAISSSGTTDPVQVEEE